MPPLFDGPLNNPDLVLMGLLVTDAYEEIRATVTATHAGAAPLALQEQCPRLEYYDN